MTRLNTCGVVILAFMLQQPAAGAMGRDSAKDSERLAKSTHQDENEFFAGSEALFDSVEYRSFLETSAHSANSQQDQDAHDTLAQAVDVDHRLDIPLHDYFAERVGESSGSPSLRALAEENRAGLASRPPRPAVAPALMAALEGRARRAAGGGQLGLRDLLRSAR